MKIFIDKEGRITIPQVIQRNLGLTPGDSFSISATDGGILLMPLKKEKKQENKESVIVISGTSEDKSRYFTLK
jgi:AbrB family looped-hinge helix DNA binding protein